MVKGSEEQSIERGGLNICSFVLPVVGFCIAGGERSRRERRDEGGERK